MITREEAKKRKAAAIMAIKFGLLEVGSVAYWKALGEAEADVNE